LREEELESLVERLEKILGREEELKKIEQSPQPWLIVLLRLIRIEQYLRRIGEIEEKRYNVDFGRYRDLCAYDVTLAPGERKLLLEAHGTGRLLDHIASVTMPDATPPEIQFEILFDKDLVLDWSGEEYYSLLGFHAVPGYGGWTIYDTVNRKYAWWTTYSPELGDFREHLQVWLHNLTDVEVHVDVWDVQLRLMEPAELKIY
jgi:hypothetical protein